MRIAVSRRRPARSTLERWRPGPGSFRNRIVASTVALVTVAMVVIGIGIELLMLYTARSDAAQLLQERADAEVNVVQAHTPRSAPTVQVPEDALDLGVRVYDASGAAVAGIVEQRAQQQADELGRARAHRIVSGRGDLKLLAQPFTLRSGQRGVIVVSQTVDPYERSRDYVLFALTIMGVFVVALAAVVARRVTQQALAPVSQMAERAEDWSEHDLTQRFELGPAYHELARLGATLDSLLDRVAQAIRSEQRLTSELAHELRTPLTTIQGAADFALLRGDADARTTADLEEISAAARTMAGVITTLVDVARDHAAAGSMTTSAVAELAPALAASIPEGVTFVNHLTPSTATVAAPSAVVLRAIAPVVDNAGRHARSAVTVSAHQHGQHVDIVVADDGSGIDERIRDRIFTPGASGTGGTGLGLGIAQRVAASLGGSIAASSSADGTAFTIRLPRA